MFSTQTYVVPSTTPTPETTAATTTLSDFASPTKTSKGGACGARAFETGFIVALAAGAVGAVL